MPRYSSRQSLGPTFRCGFHIGTFHYPTPAYLPSSNEVKRRRKARHDKLHRLRTPAGCANQSLILHCTNQERGAHRSRARDKNLLSDCTHTTVKAAEKFREISHARYIQKAVPRVSSIRPCLAGTRISCHYREKKNWTALLMPAQPFFSSLSANV